MFIVTGELNVRKHKLNVGDVQVIGVEMTSVPVNVEVVDINGAMIEDGAPKLNVELVDVMDPKNVEDPCIFNILPVTITLVVEAILNSPEIVIWVLENVIVIDELGDPICNVVRDKTGLSIKME